MTERKGRGEFCHGGSSREESAAIGLRMLSQLGVGDGVEVVGLAMSLTPSLSIPHHGTGCCSLQGLRLRLQGGEDWGAGFEAGFGA